MRAIAATAAAAALSVGCAGIMGPKTADEVARSGRPSSSNYESGQRTVFASVACGGESTPWAMCTVRMRRLTIGDTETHQAYVVWSSSDWAFFNEASLRGGDSLELARIDRQVTDSAGVVEHFGVTIPEPVLQDAKADGLRFEARGKRGRQVVEIPAYYVQGYLQAL